MYEMVKDVVLWVLLYTTEQDESNFTHTPKYKVEVPTTEICFGVVLEMWSKLVQIS